MTLLLQTFIDALREELQQLGEMLALLDQYQESACARLATTPGARDAIRAQRITIQAARARRQGVQRQLAAGLDQPETATFARIMPLLPDPYRPLIGALIQENHDALERVDQRARLHPGLLAEAAPAEAALPDVSGSNPSSCALVPDAPTHTMEPRSSC